MRTSQIPLVCVRYEGLDVIKMSEVQAPKIITLRPDSIPSCTVCVRACTNPTGVIKAIRAVLTNDVNKLRGELAQHINATLLSPQDAAGVMHVYDVEVPWPQHSPQQVGACCMVVRVAS